MRRRLLLVSGMLAACGDNAPIGNISVTMASASMAPNIVVAYQDGADAWRNADPPVGDTYTFEARSGAWGFAWMCLLPDESAIVTIYRFTVAERTHLTINTVYDGCYTPLAPDSKLDGKVTGAPPAGVYVTWGYGLAQPSASGYSMAVDAGTHDLLTTHSPDGKLVDLAAIQRGVAVTGDTKHDIDFTTALPVETAPITGVPNDAAVTSGLYTSEGTYFNLVGGLNPPAGGFVSVSLADAQAAKGDVYSLTVDDYANNVGIDMVVARATPISYVPPPPLGSITSTITATKPYLQLVTSWPSYPGATSYSWDASQQEPFIVWAAVLSPGVAGTQPSFEMPDFTTVIGFDARFAFREGAPHHTILTSASATTGRVDCFDAQYPSPQLGATSTYAYSSAILTP